VDSLNALIADLVGLTKEISCVIEAVSKDDLSQKMPLKIRGKAIGGEFLRSTHILNEMVNQLSSFASEVTRVAREVGTEGRLGWATKDSGRFRNLERFDRQCEHHGSQFNWASAQYCESQYS